jgi:transcriptional regulator with XRE-family HTH domain
MEALEVNQAWLCKQIHSSKAAVSRYLADDADNKISTLQKIARALDCSIVDLISDSDTMQQTLLQDDLLKRILKICLKVIGEEAGVKLDSESLSNVILELYQWAQKRENANDDSLEAYLSGALKHERRSANRE